MNPYIEKRGEAIVKDENLLKDPIAFTQKLLDLKSEMDNMLKTSFDNSMQFINDYELGEGSLCKLLLRANLKYLI